MTDYWQLPGRFESYSDITRNSLGHSLAENDSHLKQEDIDKLLQAYDDLEAFPDAKPALSRLATISHIDAVVFSNGTQSTVSNSVLHSQALSPNADVFRDIITVDNVKQYKPALAVYAYLATKLGKTLSQMDNVWLASGNPFDVVGARNADMNAIWVDRDDRGWVDAALPSIQPTAIVNSLEKIVEVIEGCKW